MKFGFCQLMQQYDFILRHCVNQMIATCTHDVENDEYNLLRDFGRLITRAIK